ncbi:MAG: hypothetical protein LAO31_12195 [Acidobacteriia bacterium]|nr:hypothetical protein [Terriglobia bacterium]
MWKGICVSLLSLSFTTMVWGQLSDRSFDKPPAHVKFHDGQMFVFSGTLAWTIDLSKLSIPDDECGTRCDTINGSLRQSCFGKCAWFYPDILGFDEANHRLFFSTYTDFSRNRPNVLFAADLDTGKIRHLFATWASGLSGGLLSPDGRYLAYANWYHVGGCFNPAAAYVVDLSPKHDSRSIAPPVQLGEVEFTGGIYLPKGDFPVIVPVGWKSEFGLEIKEETYHEHPCDKPIESRRYDVDVRTLRFAEPHFEP